MISSQDLQGAYFHKSADAGTISFVVPNQGIRITNQRKTAAFLNRGGPFPVVGATSGWSGAGSKEFALPEAGFQMLDAAYWMPAAFEVANSIGFSFEPHSYDKRHLSGSFFASHAEIQLMCFFIRHNYFFREYCDGDTIQDDFNYFCSEEKPTRSDFISSSPRDSCEKFADHIS